MSEDTNIAKMGKDIEYMRRDINEIKEGIKILPGLYVTQKEFNEFMSAANARFIALETNKWRVLSPILAAISGSVITYLIIEYLKNV